MNSFNLRVWGIVNLTPDSFSDGGKLTSHEQLIVHLNHLLKRGADVLDFGAQSTAPMRKLVGAQAEVERFASLLDEKVVELIKEKNLSISIDTFWPEVFNYIVEKLKHHQIADSDLKIYWNDVSGVIDESCLRALSIAEVAGLVLCHNPAQERSESLSHSEFEQAYSPSSIIQELKKYFLEKINTIDSKYWPKLILDPAFGFAKNGDTNWELLRQFHLLVREINLATGFYFDWMIGISKKRFLREKVQKMIPGRDMNGIHVFADAEILQQNIIREVENKNLPNKIHWRVHDPFLVTSQKLFS